MDPAVFPPYLRGFMLAAFGAAYMSTIGTQLNWGASYVINDFYRRFVRRTGSEREYVLASQAVTIFLMLCSIVVTLNLGSIEAAWKLLLVTGAGTGTVLLFRWFWWRINAWSEVSAMAVAAMTSLFLQLGIGWRSDQPREFAYLMLVTVLVTTMGWLVTTFLTRPESDATLTHFYQIVQPQGPGWRSVVARLNLAPVYHRETLARQLLNWLLGCVLIYGFLFGFGEVLLGSVVKGLVMMGVALVAGWSILRGLLAVEDLHAR